MSESITIAKLSGFGRGKEDVFEKSAISLGTDPGSDVRFDPTWDKTVSPRHALLEKRNDGWWLTDQSRDGSWINGQRTKNAKIMDGTVIELGRGGPRVKIQFAARPSEAGDVASQVGSTTAATGSRSSISVSVPASQHRAVEPATKSSPNGKDKAPSPSAPGGSRNAVPIALAAGAIAIVAATVLGWFAFHGKSGGKAAGEVTVITTPAPGVSAEWEPVVDMGEQIFPALIVASAAMKESPFDTVNDSPTRLGDHRGVVGIQIKNPRAHTKARVEIADNDIMRSSVFEGDLPTAGETYTIYPTPNYRFDELRKIKQTTPISLAISASLNGASLGQKGKTVRVASINDCPFAVLTGSNEQDAKAVRMDWMFSAFVNENHPISDELRKEALKTGLVTSFSGYQGGADGVYNQIFAIWYVLQRRGVHYSSITTTPGASKDVYSQYVRFIDQSINNSQANCVDGSVLFASVMRQIGIEPILVLVPGHMFVGFYVDPKGSQADFLETTMIGNIPSNSASQGEARGFGSKPEAIKGMLEPSADTKVNGKTSLEGFSAAIKTARGEYAKYFGDGSTAERNSLYKGATVQKEKANCQAMPVIKAREMGVMPIGYTP